jgi:hypothetical protein
MSVPRIPGASVRVTIRPMVAAFTPVDIGRFHARGTPAATVLSPEAVTMSFPSGLKCALEARPRGFESEQQLAALSIPEPGGVVPRVGDDAPPIGAELRARNTVLSP